MRKLIRSKRTNLFLTVDGQWTDDLGEAGDFEVNFSGWKMLPKQPVELYYSFDTDQGPYDFTISMGTPSSLAGAS